MYNIIKNATDYLLAVIGLIIFFPFSLFYSLLIILLYRANPIYLQKRSIDGNNYLTIYKLKTIKDNAIVKNADNISFYKIVTEDSFYFLGRFMRMTGIDEIPQLINVLKGEMSIIGPRPLMKNDLELIKSNNPSLLIKRSRIKAKPGISGFWQLYRNCQMDFEELVDMDIYYDQNLSWELDFHLLLKTSFNVITVSHSDTLQSLKKCNSEPVEKNVTVVKYFSHIKN